LELAPELRMYLLGIYLPEEWWGMGFGQQLYDLACELASELVLEDVVQYPVGKTARGELRRDYLLRRGWMPCEDDQVRRFVI
jgi:hypothetical protein